MMLKTYSKDGKTCEVKFKLPSLVRARTAVLCGDFTGRNEPPRKMRRLRGGGFMTTLLLPSGHYYRFHYVLDGSRWMSDPAADISIPNAFGMEESILKV